MKIIFLILAFGTAITFSNIHTKNSSMTHKPSRYESVTMQTNNEMIQSTLVKNKTMIISFQLQKAISASNC
jgi:hypothetical protein